MNEDDLQKFNLDDFNLQDVWHSFQPDHCDPVRRERFKEWLSARLLDPGEPYDDKDYDEYPSPESMNSALTAMRNYESVRDYLDQVAS